MQGYSHSQWRYQHWSAVWTQACPALGGWSGGAAFGFRCQSGVLELEQAAEYQEPASIKEKLEHLPLYSAPNFNLWVLVLPGSCVEFF